MLEDKRRRRTPKLEDEQKAQYDAEKKVRALRGAALIPPMLRGNALLAYRAEFGPPDAEEGRATRRKLSAGRRYQLHEDGVIQCVRFHHVFALVRDLFSLCFRG